MRSSPSASSTVEVLTNSALTFSNVVDGAGGLIKTEPGTLTLAGSNANTYAGTTTVNDGKLILKKPDGTNAIPGALVVGDSVGAANADQVQWSASDQIPDTAPIENWPLASGK